MQLEFEWDEAKRLSNIRKHGIDFEQARLLFDGRSILTVRSSFSVEERFLTTAELDGNFITVVWTQRAGSIRLISARSARNAEERAYRSLYGG